MTILWSYCPCIKTSYLLQFGNFFSQYLIKIGKKFLYKDSKIKGESWSFMLRVHTFV
jgi:hypothetical protein